MSVNEENNNASTEEVVTEEATINQLDNILPVGDYEEEVSVNGQKEVRKGIYLLPNLFTTGALFAGFYAIVNGMQGRFEEAAIAVFAAIILDIIDGRVARMVNAQSAFGAEYDSLSDMVSFGVAPALVVYSWALNTLGKFGWAAAFIYLAGAAVRLARFNTQPEVTDKRYFIGLASPSAAALLVLPVWLSYDLGWVGSDLPFAVAIAVALVTVIAGLLMVSNIRYYSFKGIDFRKRVPFIALILVIVLFAIVTIDPPTVLLSMLIVYVLLGPILHFKTRVVES